MPFIPAAATSAAKAGEFLSEGSFVSVKFFDIAAKAVHSPKVFAGVPVPVALPALAA
jgi:hypothetical protein